LSTAKSQKARLGKVTAKAIKEVATNIDKRIVRMRKPEVTFPVRSLGNLRYDPRKGYFEIGKDRSARTLSVNTAKSFAQTLKRVSGGSGAVSSLSAGSQASSGLRNRQAISTTFCQGIPETGIDCLRF